MSGTCRALPIRPLPPTASALARSLAGAASTISFTYGQPALKRAGCHDALGVLSLHMVPGLMGGAVSAIAAACIDPPRWSHEAINEARDAPQTQLHEEEQRTSPQHIATESSEGNATL